MAAKGDTDNLKPWLTDAIGRFLCFPCGDQPDQPLCSFSLMRAFLEAWPVSLQLWS